jgi:hypothetical protein
MEEQFGHAGVVADGFAVFEGAGGKAVAGGEAGDGAGEAELAGDDFLGEIAFADEIGDDVEVRALDHIEDLAVAGFLLPEGANDLGEEVTAADFGGVLDGGGTGIGVHGGAVAEEDEGAIGLSEGVSLRHGRKTMQSRRREVERFYIGILNAVKGRSNFLLHESDGPLFHPQTVD